MGRYDRNKTETYEKRYWALIQGHTKVYNVILITSFIVSFAFKAHGGILYQYAFFLTTKLK